jgi:hypothetical protein
VHLHQPQVALVGDRLGRVDDLAGGQADARAAATASAASTRFN